MAKSLTGKKNNQSEVSSWGKEKDLLENNQLSTFIKGANSKTFGVMSFKK